MPKIAPEKVEEEKVLMLVKAYPQPSAKYGETVCTAGIRLRDMKWIRVYPYPFRLIEEHYRFKKWDVIQVPLQRSTQDPRPDSFRLYDVAKISCVDHIEVGDKWWTPRMVYIRQTAKASVEDLLSTALPKHGWGASILPVPVAQKTARLIWEEGGDWSEEQLQKLKIIKQKVESNLFEPGKKYFPLRARPFKFRLNFADLTGKEYTFSIIDWEIYQLYFNSRKAVGTDEEAIEKVRQKIEDEIFAPDRETFVVLGSIHQQYRKKHLFAVDGFVWPLKQSQPDLF